MASCFLYKRRELITLLSGAAAVWPLAARAQQSAKTRVGIKSIQPRTSPIYAAFDQCLRELGYIEGQNLIVDFLNPEDQAEGIARAIKELVRRKVSVFDQSMKLIGVLDVEVATDTGNLQEKIRSITGSRGIRVRSSNGQIVLSGVAGNAVAAERAVAVASGQDRRR